MICEHSDRPRVLTIEGNGPLTGIGSAQQNAHDTVLTGGRRGAAGFTIDDHAHEARSGV